MKGLIQTIKNIFTIEELRNRILLTLGLIVIYRLGSYVVLPGVNPDALASYSNRASQGLFGLINMFAGGAFSRASIFSLGIMPYISASIVIQLLGIAVPYFQKLQKEGESGRQKINQLTRILIIAITAVQAAGFLINLKSQVPPTAFAFSNGTMSMFMFMFTNIVILTTGTMFVMWLGEKITDRGLGNGISLIIMIGIIARLPHALISELDARMSEAGGGLVMFMIELVSLLLVVIAVVALMFIPATIGQFLPGSTASQNILGALQNHTSVLYNVLFSVLIIVFTYFYTAVTINPTQIADDLKRNGGFIPGIKPGKKTSEYIDTIMSRITLPGAIFLAFIAIFPAIAGKMNVNSQFAQFYGGTSLLILVGVVLDTLQQIESHLLMRHYDGLMKSGRIKGRSSLSGVSTTTAM
jgi:preprotein translocase subunit SecY